MLRKLFAASLLSLLALFGAAQAQTPSPAPYGVIGGQTTLAVSNSSSNVALPATTPPYGALTILNRGSADAYVALGATSGVTATTSSLLIPAGAALNFYAGASNTYLAGITASGSANLVIYQASSPVAASSGTVVASISSLISAQAYYFNGSVNDAGFTCTSSATVSVTATNTTQLVALAASQTIRVCAFAITSSAAGTAKFVTGTGTNCAGSPADLTGAFTMATGTPIALTGMSGSILRSSVGGELCLTATGGNITGVVSYAQF